MINCNEKEIHTPQGSRTRALLLESFLYPRKDKIHKRLFARNEASKPCELGLEKIFSNCTIEIDF